MSRSSDVTVIMPNYNHAKYLPESLGAIFVQSQIPKEVIVIDDASKDDSISVIQQLQQKHPQIKLIQNDINQGPVVSLNIALKKAQGKYLAFCSADDHVLPGFFEECSKWLDHYPNAGICSSDPSLFKNIKPYRFLKMSLSYQTKVTEIRPEEIGRKFLLTPLWIPSHASLFRKDFVLQCKGFSERLYHLADWYLNVKIAAIHGIVHVPKSFGAFRISDQSYSAQCNRSYKKKALIYKELFYLLSQEPAALKKLFYQSGVLGHISSDVLLYMMFHSYLWKYIPSTFLRKICNLFRKIRREIIWKYH